MGGEERKGRVEGKGKETVKEVIWKRRKHVTKASTTNGHARNIHK